MKLKEFSLPLVLLILAALLAGTSIYLNTRKPKLPNESKSQLTSPTRSTNETQFNNSKVPLNDKIRTFLNKSLRVKKDAAGPVESPLVTQERLYTEDEINRMSAENFKSLLVEVELRMPKITDIKKLPAEALHRTPEPILEAGKDLGLIKEIITRHEGYTQLAIGFYDNCAKSDERPTPVRALCLTNLALQKKKRAEKINLRDYPNQVIDLAKMITDL